MLTVPPSHGWHHTSVLPAVLAANALFTLSTEKTFFKEAALDCIGFFSLPTNMPKAISHIISYYHFHLHETEVQRG